MRKNLLIPSIIGFIFVSIIGTLSHFFYDWTGQNVLIGLVTPVNESVWEHMKLAFFPMILYIFLEKLWLKEKTPFSTCINLISVLIATFLIPVRYYTYSGILGKHSMILDIATFFYSIFSAFVFRYVAAKKGWQPKHCWLFYTLVVATTVAFLVFTYYPPALGIFQSQP